VITRYFLDTIPFLKNAIPPNSNEVYAWVALLLCKDNSRALSGLRQAAARPGVLPLTNSQFSVGHYTTGPPLGW